MSSRLVVNSVCSYRVKGKPKPVFVASKVSQITYQAYDGKASDSQAHACGTAVTAANRGYFKVATLGAYRVVVLKVVAAPRNPKLYGKVTQASFKPVSVVLTRVPGYKAYCGTSATVHIDPPAVLCSQTDSGTIPCGVAVPGGCVWATKPVKNGNVISVTQPVCASGNCWTVPLPRASTSTWLGVTIPAGTLECSDHSEAEFLLQDVTLTNTAGVACGPYYPVNSSFMSFTVPSGWGGTLKVSWRVESRGPDGKGLGAELVGATLDLTGTQDGCPQLKADPNSVYDG